jgi:hypothetical protein
MIKNNKLALSSLTAAMFAVSAGAFAHTSIRDKATEGTTSYNYLNIGHGCTDINGNKIPVIAQSVVFPTDVDAVATREKDNKVVALSDIIDQGSLAGLISAIQDKNIFTTQDTITDVNGNVIGFYGKDGSLQTNLRGLLPFRFNSVTFKTNTCTAGLYVKAAVADICVATFPPTPETANLWIPNATTNFGADLDGIGSAPTLTINRTSTVPETNMNGTSCRWTDSTGASRLGWYVTVTPSTTQVDRDLQIPGYWPAP